MKETVMERVSSDPFARFLGIAIEEVREGEARVSIVIKDHLLNFHGAANGGLIFSLADVAFAIASNSYGQTSVGINVSMNYMLAAKEGGTLTATAEEVSGNPKLGLYRLTVRNQYDEMIAVADGMVYRKKEQFA